MDIALYDELTPWYRLLDATEDHIDEASIYEAAIRRALGLPAGKPTLLDLGAGAGNNAFYLKGAFECTLSDLSAPMLELSEAINPECTHVVGDMREMRLQESFDAVLVHDAVVYMRTEDELRAAMQTAFVHTKPGGVAIVATDCTVESFQDATSIHTASEGTRSLRCLDYTYDPDPSDTSYTVDYAFLLRDGNQVRAVHDRHLEGLFPRATWIQVLEQAGFEVSVAHRTVDEDEPYTDEFFVARRAS